MKKRAQTIFGLSFSFIFSVFLIIIFIAVAFFSLKNFLNFQKSADVVSFYDKFQKEVEVVWKSESSRKEFLIKLPKEVKYVCFSNLSDKITGSEELYKQIRHFEFYDANTFILPASAANGMEFKKIKYLDIKKITKDRNPYCVLNGDIVILEKDIYDKLVSLSKKV